MNRCTFLVIVRFPAEHLQRFNTSIRKLLNSLPLDKRSQKNEVTTISAGNYTHRLG